MREVFFKSKIEPFYDLGEFEFEINCFTYRKYDLKNSTICCFYSFDSIWSMLFDWSLAAGIDFDADMK